MDDKIRRFGLVLPLAWKGSVDGGQKMTAPCRIPLFLNFETMTEEGLNGAGWMNREHLPM